MEKLSRTLKIWLAALLAIFSTGITQLYTAPSAYAAPDTNKKTTVSFCHATGNGSWVSLETAPEVVFQAGHDTHQDGRDIIPSFEYVKHGQTITFPGLNYDAEGQAILANDCVRPNIVTPVTPTITQPTCDVAYGVLHLTASTTYVYKIGNVLATDGMQLAPDTTVTVNAVASTTGTVFPGYATTYAFALTVNALPTDCDEPVVVETNPLATVTKLCGVGNDLISASVSNNEEYSLTSDSGWVSSDSGYVRTLTYTAAEGYLFSNESTTYTEVFTDNDAACAAPQVTNATCNSTSFLTLPAAGEQYVWQVTINGTAQLVPTASDPQTVAVPAGAHLTVNLLYNGEQIVAAWSYDVAVAPTNCVPVIHTTAPTLAKVDQDGKPLSGATVSGYSCTRWENSLQWLCESFAAYSPIDPNLDWDFIINNVPVHMPTTAYTTDQKADHRIMMWEVSAPEGYVITPKTYAVEYRCGAWRLLEVADRTAEALAAADDSSCQSTILANNSFLWVNVKPGMGHIDGEAVTTTVAKTPLPATLPATGPSDNSMFLVIGLFASLFSYGAVYFAQPKRQV